MQLNAVQTLLGLLSHDNSDISLAVVDLLQELSDVDSVDGSEEEAQRLVEALLREQVKEHFTAYVQRLVYTNSVSVVCTRTCSTCSEDHASLEMIM